MSIVNAIGSWECNRFVLNLQRGTCNTNACCWFWLHLCLTKVLIQTSLLTQHIFTQYQGYGGSPRGWPTCGQRVEAVLQSRDHQRSITIHIVSEEVKPLGGEGKEFPLDLVELARHQDTYVLVPPPTQTKLFVLAQVGEQFGEYTGCL